ncbi:BZ3500_MvSof-1268-A1-R1_Chr2-3g05377 [Microbotryum saponariae]|uniref:BZ3500_MvSof-1268-A1-R1_Chr2-3g05377 protein n=1 Tax=Microbotryum saponariae TaxID=289078 RepID=A0A2X0LXQ5_9BASI|nr:BZ3500_MvSof-1268-A1-R1_Chr2-3g05377 [Microbotryum saponariae]SDA01315.1 BZ3501_MvSof-1269-A2-R1_Chr2-2g05050 [Microbotryum saponariae]
MKEAPTQLADGERTALSYRLIDPSTGMPPVYLRDADNERVGRSELCSRQIGLELATPEAVVVEALQRIRDQGMPAACNIATNSKANGKLPSRNSLQHVLSECQPSSCFFTVSCGSIDFVRLRIRVIGTLNKTASGRVNCGSPGRSSTARFGDPKQCLPVIPQVIANPNRRRLPFHAASY